MVKKYIATTGNHAAYQINHARILLKADCNQPDGSWGCQRNGQANSSPKFMVYEPMVGWRRVEVTRNEPPLTMLID